ncbi:MAG: DUF1566 domain-containing protein [Rikenellaceae bacterium]
MKTAKCKLLILAMIIFGTLAQCQSTNNSLNYPLVATGQVVCYDINGNEITAPSKGDSLYGQDANYLMGLPMSYVDNGDGTISDLNTGLTWQKTPPTEGMTWYEAIEYCENLELAGYSDWRMPTLKELFAISNFSTGWPYLNTEYFDLATGSVGKDEQYWALNKYVGETVEGRSDAAFGVNHATGHIKAYAAGGSMSNRGGAPGQGGGQGNQQGGRPEAGQGRPQGGQPGGNMPQRPEGDTTRMAGRGGAPGQGGGQGNQQGGRPEAGQSRPQGGQPGGNMPQRPEGDTTRMAGRGGAPGQGGSKGNQQGHEAGQGRPQGEQPGGQNGQQNGGKPGGMMMANPMAKHVRAVRGNVYGINEFVDNGDGTITDKATGLMWAKEDNGKGIEWGEALTYAENASLANYSDWRLPNVKELQSIVDYSYAPSSTETKPAINPIFSCTPFINEAGDDDFGYYWTGTSACFRKGQPFYFAWYVAFGRAVNNEGKDFHGAGAVRFDSKSDNGQIVEGGEERYFNFVRLVRSTK